MTPKQIQLVQETLQQITPISDTAASLFYNRLFTLDPTLRPLFRTDMNTQGKKLMAMLKLAVRGLDRPYAIVPAVQQLGQRHVRYGIRPQQYATVGEALLWTLQQGLGDDFTPEVAEAWTAAYALLANDMQAGAAEVVA